MPDPAAHTARSGAVAQAWRDEALAGAWLMHAQYRRHRFDKHLHDELVIVVTERGSGEVQTPAGTARSSPGTVWIFAPGEYHAGRVDSDSGWSYRSIYMDVDAVALLEAASFEACRGGLTLAPGLYGDEQLARTLVRAHAAEGLGTPLAGRQSLWREAMSLLLSRCGGGEPGRGRPARDHSKLRAAREYVRQNCCRDFSIEELAGSVGLSRFHLMRSFQREFGLPPHAYANQLKLIAAKRKLRVGVPPAQVAAEVGFYDQSHLTRLFKRAFGLTPARFAALYSAH